MNWSPPRPRGLAMVGGAVSAGAALVWLMLGGRADRAQIEVGRVLYAEHCACHGSNLEGQTDWQMPLPNGRMPAPPHNAAGRTWHHADSELFAIAKHGMGAVVPGYESDMPAFVDTLTDDQIKAVLAYIGGSWTRRQREYQAAQTSARP